LPKINPTSSSYVILRERLLPPKNLLHIKQVASTSLHATQRDR